MIEVTQADREAAWRIRPGIFDLSTETNWMNGVYDNMSFIQTFAAHRIAQMERDAVISETEPTTLGHRELSPYKMRRAIAKAIREQDDE